MIQRTLLFAPLFLLLPNVSFAQFSIGASAGANLSFWQWTVQTPDISVDLDYQSRLSGRAAVHVEYAFSPVLSLRADVANQVVRNKFTHLTDANGADITNINLTNNYNSVGGSLLVKVSPVGKVRNVYFLAGPTVACITNGWRRVHGEPIEGVVLGKRTIDLDAEKIRRVQWMGDLGVGYGYPLGAKGRLIAEMRYQIGLSNFSTSSVTDARVQSAMLLLGYFYQL